MKVELPVHLCFADVEVYAECFVCFHSAGGEVCIEAVVLNDVDIIDAIGKQALEEIADEIKSLIE